MVDDRTPRTSSRDAAFSWPPPMKDNTNNPSATRISVFWSFFMIFPAGVSDDSLEEAVLGVLGSIDAPGSPAGEIKQAYHQNLFGNSAEKREEKRKKILGVTADDLLEVAERYLSAQPSLAAVVSENSSKELSSNFRKINVSG